MRLLRLCRLKTRPHELYADTRDLPEYAALQFDLTMMEAADKEFWDRMHKDLRKIAGPDGKRDPMGVGRCVRWLQAIVEVLS